MKRLMFRLFAFCMALSWVPAIAHCRLEAVGMDFAACSAGCHGEASSHDNGDDPSKDGCDLIENGFYKASVDAVKVAPPAATLYAGLLCLSLQESEPDAGLLIAPAAAERPQAWVSQWTFVRRAAAPAHAPDSLFA
jgi:hypothetical protein